MKTKKILFWTLAVFGLGHLNSQTPIHGRINDYAAVTFIAGSEIHVNDSRPFHACDKVLIIQMKGALIDTTNTSSYGNVTSYGNAGNYEFGYIQSVSGSNIVLSASLTRAYTISGLVQLIRVPVYDDVDVTSALNCLPWNGTVGGVLAFEACHVNLSADIDVSSCGFGGGVVVNAGFANGHQDYVLPAPSLYAANKGEGIFITHASSQQGRGKNANGGGGGDDINGGGAGGSNCGAGGTGGNINSSYAPTAPYICGGVGGAAMPYNAATNKVFLGGGGGAGHANDGYGTSGATGGGIVIIECTGITGNSNSIKANGRSVTIVAGIDGQGGGGAGGAILLKYPGSAAISSVLFEAAGGDGGTDSYSGYYCHGKGGGGGGGVIWSSFTLPGTIGTNVSGGLAGAFTIPLSACYAASPYGASNGSAGCKLIELHLIKGTTNCPAHNCPTKGKLTGLNEQKAKEWDVTIFPNPSSGSVLIEGLASGEKTHILVTDITGKVIMDKDVNVTDGTYHLDFPAEQATYFIELKNGANQVTHKKVVIAK